MENIKELDLSPDGKDSIGDYLQVDGLCHDGGIYSRGAKYWDCLSFKRSEDEHAENAETFYFDKDDIEIMARAVGLITESKEAGEAREQASIKTMKKEPFIDHTKTPFGNLIYCLAGWNDALAEGNQGDADNWLNHVRRSLEIYLDWESAQDAEQEEPKEWKDGLPPDGEKCLLNVSKAIAYEVTLEWASDKNVVFRHCDDDAEQFAAKDWFKANVRPLKSQAEKEREEAINSMIAACPYSGSKSTKIDCEALYDAGYRLDTKGGGCMSDERPVFELAEHLQSLKYPEEVEWALNELIRAIGDDETIKMSCALAKKESKEYES